MYTADTNECGNSNGGCAQTCHNTAGSYYCTCGTGYSLASNSHGCNGEFHAVAALKVSSDTTFVHVLSIDVNECDTNNGGCSQTCTNTIGSFECLCNTGYELDSDESTCIGKLNTYSVALNTNN